jgi:flagellar hook assembly protein FlgD
MLYKENTSNETLVIEPEIISPDGDGFQDFLQINYRFTSNDITMNLFIINERGLKVKELALAERVGYEGFVLWDGTTDNGSLPNEGVYLVRQEFFNSNGQFEVNQKPILFTRRARID